MIKKETVPENDLYLINFSLKCKHCNEELEDYNFALIHLRSYHLDAYQYWKAQSIPASRNENI